MNNKLGWQCAAYIDAMAVCLHSAPGIVRHRLSSTWSRGESQMNDITPIILLHLSSLPLIDRALCSQSLPRGNMGYQFMGLRTHASADPSWVLISQTR